MTETPDIQGRVAELRELIVTVTELLPITVHNGPDYAEAYGTDFQAMTMRPERFEALAKVLPGLPSLLDEITALREALQMAALIIEHAEARLWRGRPDAIRDRPVDIDEALRIFRAVMPEQHP